MVFEGIMQIDRMIKDRCLLQKLAGVIKLNIKFHCWLGVWYQI